MNELADASMLILTLVMVALLAAGAARGPTAGRSRNVLLAVLGGWLVLVTALSFGGLLAMESMPPRWPLLPLTAFLAIGLTSRTQAVRFAVTRLPRAWPIAAQTFRVGVEIALFALHAAGRAPVQITFEGRNFDIFVGLTAPLVAWLVASQRLGPKGAIAWNVAGLLVLANTVATVATSTPGPLHLPWPGAPLTELTAWPIVWLPAFLMPAAVFLHVLSLRQNIAALRASTT